MIYLINLKIKNYLDSDDNKYYLLAYFIVFKHNFFNLYKHFNI